MLYSNFNRNGMRKSTLAFALLLSACTLHSCGIFRNVIVEQDEVSGTKRNRTEFQYYGAREWSSPLMRINQTILKETGPTGMINVRVFDRIQLQVNSFRLEKLVYLIIDGKPYSTQVDDMEFDRLTSIQEKRKDIVTADSSKVSVVTGYDKSDSKYYKLTYTLNPETLENIKTCKKLRFRYYSGPDMITTTMSAWELNLLQYMLERP